MMCFLSRVVFRNHSLRILCSFYMRLDWRELASYLGPAMLAHLYMGLNELVMRGSEDGKKS